jgi:peptide/nickel transport system permease protein
MLRYLIIRVLLAALTILVVVSAVFFIFFVLPGGGGHKGPAGVSPVAVLLAGRTATIPEMRGIEHELGLDDPLPVQYGRFVGNIVHGDLGFSFAAGAPVSRVVWPAIPASLSIALGASALWVVAGIWIGVASAGRRNIVGDRAFMLIALAALSIPVFVASLVGIALVLRFTGAYAGNRYVGITEDPLQWLQAMWLPWICLALPLIAVYARMVRSNVLEVRGEDYIRTSWAKGLRRKQVSRHELRGSLTPIVTMYGLDFGILVGGSVIVEKIFRIPGLGNLMLSARDTYDFPVMAGVVIVASIAIIIANLIVDILYSILDPRVRTDLLGPPAQI